MNMSIGLRDFLTYYTFDELLLFLAIRKRAKTSSQALCFKCALLEVQCIQKWRGKTIKIKTFTLMFIMVYIVISLPAMLGIGYVIDWIPEATVFQKIKGYAIEGLANNYLSKTVVSGIISVIIQSYFYTGWKQ